MRLTIRNWKPIQIHLLFWMLFIVLGVVTNVAQHHQGRVTFALFWSDLIDPLTSIGYGRTIIMCYLSLWIFDSLFTRRFYGLAVIALVGLIAGDVMLRYGIEQMLLGPYFGIWQYPANITVGTYFIETVFFSALGIFLCFLLKIVNDYFRNEAVSQEKVKMELAYLKAQLNPHFLFNTMNNLYGLSLTEPEKTPDVILRLSEMMRYMLYESNETYVPVSQEVIYLNNFIELETLRYPRQIFVDFLVEGDVNGKRIAPLLLIAFVENSFKHGQLQNAKSPVSIRLSISGDSLHFETCNTITTCQRDHTGGVGLKNVQRRLALLYPGHHKMSIFQEMNTFKAILSIQLH